AARRLEAGHPDEARETYLMALRAASVAGRLAADTLRPAAEAAGHAPRPDHAPRAVDRLVTGLAIRFTEGYAASAETLKAALRALCAEAPRDVRDVRWPGFARRIALDLFDADTCRVLVTRGVELARERGALGVLPHALDFLGLWYAVDGRLDAAER